MQLVRWNVLKSERLKRERGVSFEEIIRGKLIAVKKHPKKEHQDIMLVEYKSYIWIVPFIKTDGEIFLKTLYPSRKYTKNYRKEKDDERN